MSKTVYFLGAGVSKEAGAPTQKEMWEQVVHLWKTTGDEKIKAVLDFAGYLNLDISGSPVKVNIAEVLTLVDMALEQDVSLGCYDPEFLRKIRHYFVYAICQVLKNSACLVKGKVFAAFCHALDPGDIVISLNYDTIIDGILMDCPRQVSYGFYLEDFFGHMMGVSREGQLLLKPHGSLNWLFCRCCNGMYLASKEDEVLAEPGFFCPKDRHRLNEVIVTPTYQKKFLVPQLHQVWGQCFQELKKADAITFLGYSFPPGDVHIIYLIKRAILAGGKNPEIKVVVPDSQGLVLARCESIFSRCRFFNTSFGRYFTSGTEN